MHIVLFLINLALVLISAVFAMSLLDVKRKSEYLLGLYLFSYAVIVLTLEACGLFSAINQTALLLTQFLICAILFFIWHKREKPILLKPLQSLNFKEMIAAARQFPLLTFVLASSTGVYLFHALKILFIPPYNSDSMTQHLSRVGYWLQYQSFYPWPTSKISQTIYPMNAELGLLWTILPWGNDQLAAFTQWITIPVIMLGIYGLTTLLGYPRPQALLTALLWGTLPQVLFQSLTTQNDLAVAAFIVALIYFLFAGFKERSHSLLYLSGLAFALAIGTKNILLMNLPALALTFGLIYLTQRREKDFYQLLKSWTIAALIAFLFVGSFPFIQNTAAFGRPLGPDAFTLRAVGVQQNVPLLTRYAERLRDNAGKYIYQMADFSPLPFRLAQKINPLKAALFSSLFEQVGIKADNPNSIGRSSFSFNDIPPFDENRSWYGPLLILLLPLILYEGIKGTRKKDVTRISLSLFFIAFFVIQSAMMSWTPVRGRYYATVIALAFPLLAALLGDSTRLRRVIRFALVVVSLSGMFTIVSYESDFREISWKQFLAGQRNPPQWESYFMYQAFTSIAPEDASVGVAFGRDAADYPLFGERFTRRVTRAIPQDMLMPRADIAAFKQDFENSDYLFTSQYNPPPALADKFFILVRNAESAIRIRKDLRDANACDADQWPLADIYASTSKIVCPQFPVSVGRSEANPVNDKFMPAIDADAEEFFEFNLLVKQATEAAFTISMHSGNVKADQNLQFSITGSHSKQQIFSAPFNSAKKNGDVTFMIPLEPGVYTIRLSIASGQATSRILQIRVSAE